MNIIKFRDEIINGNQISIAGWSQATEKDDLLVEIFTNVELFKDLSGYWRELERRANTTSGTSFDLCYTWWRYFGKQEQCSLYIVTVWDGTKIVAIAPFYKGYSTSKNMTLEVELNVIGNGDSSNGLLGYGISDSLDILADRAYLNVITEILMDVLIPEFLGVDIITLPPSVEDSYITKHICPRLKELKRNVRVQ